LRGAAFATAAAASVVVVVAVAAAAGIVAVVAEGKSTGVETGAADKTARQGGSGRCGGNDDEGKCATAGE